MTYTFEHPQLGTVRVTVRRNARRLRAGWKKDQLAVTAPSGMSPDHVAKILDENAASIKRLRKQLLFYSEDCCVSLAAGVKVHIRHTPNLSKDIEVRPVRDSGKTEFLIAIHPDLPYSLDNTQNAISTALKAIARHIAPSILIPRAKELADRHKLNVRKWEIGKGRKLLGLCFTRERRIKLSYMCVFLPDELIDFVICHELAHLSVGGHTRAFHALCDEYLSGSEAEMRAQMRNFKWPVC